MRMWTGCRGLWRRLARTPMFSIGVVVTFAVPLAAGGTLVSLMDAVLLRPLPFAGQQQLVWVWATRVDRDRAFFSLPDYLEHVHDAGRAEDLVALSNWAGNLTGGAEPVRLQGLRATGNLTRVLAFQPALGRGLEPIDEAPESPAVVVLSHRVWIERFGGDPAVLGRTLLLNGDKYAIVGVLPRSFVLPNLDTDVIGALKPLSDPRRADRDTNFLRVIARLYDGQSREALGEVLAATTERLRRAYPEANGKKTRPRVIPLAEELIGRHRAMLAALGGAAALVLLLVTANVAHLLLARAVARAPELAIRASLGASPGSLRRLVVAEPVALALTGAVLGVAAAVPLLRASLSFLPDMPRAATARIGSETIACAVLAALISGLLAGVLPAWAVSRRDLPAAQTVRTYSAWATGRWLLAVETALCVALVSGALLATARLAALLHVDLGVRTSHVLSARVSLPPARYGTGERLNELTTRILTTLRESTDVEAAGAANVLPLSGLNVRSDFTIVDRPAATSTDMPGGQHRWVTPEYFAAMGIRLEAGRFFTDFDDAASQRVAIVDAVLARKFWAGTVPVGAQLRLGGATTELTWNVVGVVAGVKHESVDESPGGTLYMPLAQVPPPFVPFLVNGMSVVVCTRGAPERAQPILRDAVRRHDRMIAVSTLSTMEAIVQRNLAPRRLIQRLVSLLAALALLVGCTGVAAVSAALVAQRQRDLAIKRAIGASSGRVWSDVVWTMVRPACAGILAGWCAAQVAARFIAHSMGGEPIGAQPLVLLAAVAVLAGTVAGAAVPAWRAARVDPAAVLRT